MCRRKPRRARQSTSALDTLAEVSKHHPDISDSINTSVNHDRQYYVSSNNITQDDEAMRDHHLLQGEKRLRRDTRFEAFESGTSVNANVGNLPSPSEISGSSEHLSTTFQLPSITTVESDNNVMSSSSSTSPMILTASAAASSEDLVANGAILEPEIGNSNASISDEYFRFEKRIDSLWPIQVIDPVLHSSKRSSLISGKYYQARDHEQSGLSTAHVRITHDPTEDKVGSLKTSKSKARCKFSDERRKEVQEIRRQGACIRCRMLKKPCSNENPCSTCIGVESARLWKQPCVRTRIADELTFFSAGLKQAMASRAMRQIRSRVRHDVFTDKIKVTHFPMDDVYVVLAPQKTRHTSNAALSPRSSETEEQDPYTLRSPVLPDVHDKDVTGMIEDYIHTIAVRDCGLGTSDFMNITCNTAKSLTLDKKSTFISQILDLWTATQILTNPSLPWTVHTISSSRPCSPPSYSPTSELLNADTIQTEISPSEQPDSHYIIILQLLTATEKCAAKLGKAIMNELERRLLQRRQANPFETFLVTIILLACTGQMAWYFRKLEVKSDGKSIVQNSEASWPLDRPPAQFIEQSEQLRDLLYMLLKTRGIPGSNTTKGKGCSNDFSKFRDRNKKRKGNEEASLHRLKGKNVDNRSMRDEARNMVVNESSDKFYSTSSSSASNAKFFANKDDNVTNIIASHDRVVSSPTEIGEDHLHKEIQTRWYVAVRDVILNDDDNDDDNNDNDFVTQDTHMEVTKTATAAEKLEADEKDVGLLGRGRGRDPFDPNNPRSWELKYTRALLRLGI